MRIGWISPSFSEFCENIVGKIDIQRCVGKDVGKIGWYARARRAEAYLLVGIDVGRNCWIVILRSVFGRAEFGC